MKNYKAYLFDLDGTLVNSEPLKGKAIALTCHDYGFPVDYHIYQDVMGQHWSAVTAHFFRQAGFSPDQAEFDQKFRAHYEQLLSRQLALNAGAADYLQWLKNTTQPCAVVSSGARWMVECILSAMQIADIFSVVIGREDVTRHKPDPEGYLSALSQLGVTPEEAVVFEDSAAGIAAGVACGCDVVAFAHEFNAHNDLSKAVQVISDYDQMRR
ncbi:Phosphorylated carbohydrates phosphatase [Vibrio aerogenes CECT 7868]|uniref:Phosphorylated carbohydrates phosphatase n=1 Tax=Vibrio aerogenes CECT 7868 TaxID=1216006 RepID=A0A1M5Z982_9VIBR|nr:HAD family phosphatase [Vibrio aerogenes]SHI20777.1 Phosphorylated carbohydrates phosphatase [Vibrio aerogenes CECT 7868]